MFAQTPGGHVHAPPPPNNDNYDNTVAVIVALDCVDSLVYNDNKIADN